MLSETDFETLRTIDEIAARESMQVVIAGIKLGTVDVDPYAPFSREFLERFKVCNETQ